MADPTSREGTARLVQVAEEVTTEGLDGTVYP